MPKLKYLPKFLAAFGLLSISSAFAEQIHIFRNGQGDSVLEYRISLTKDTFFLHERMHAQVWAKNVSSIPVKLMQSRLFGWNIIDSKGKNYQPPRISHSSMFAPFIKPQDSIGTISRFWGYGINDTLNFTMPSYLPTGRYTALHPLDTIPFTFTVVEPAEEETEVLKQYLDAYSLTRTSEENRSRFSSIDERIALFKERAESLLSIAKRFPKSVYTRQALMEAFYYQTDNEIQHKIIQGILEYPADEKRDIVSMLKAVFPQTNSEVQQKIVRTIIDEFSEHALSFQPDLFVFLKQSFYQQKDYWNELERIIKTNKNEKLVAAAKEALRKDKK